MSDIIAERWKKHRYPRYAHDLTHPTRLRTAAAWMGIDAPPTETARVLELGCAVGDNIIPMAARMPRAHFVGVDLNAEAIALGKSIVGELGLTNITLLAGDVRAVPTTGEPYDYIIVHGLWSWVPADVQEHVLHLLAARLAPNGVAHVSFNALPGWHIWGGFREMLLERFGHLSDPMEQAEHALDYLEWLAESQGSTDGWWSSVVASQLARSKVGGLANIAHDQLSPVSTPQYNHQFARRLSPHGLAWAGQVDLDDNFVASRPETTQQLVDGVVDIVERSVLLDAVVGRTFSHSLVCRAQHTPRLPTGPLPHAWWTGKLTAPDRLELDSSEAVVFRTEEGTEVEVRSRLMKETLRAITLGMPFTLAELGTHLRDHIGTEEVGSSDLAHVGMSLFRWAQAGVLRADVERPEAQASDAGIPVVDPLVRHAALNGHPIVGRLHTLLDVDEIDRLLLPVFDGVRGTYDAMQILETRLGEGPLGGVRSNIDLPPPGPERTALAASLVRARCRAWREARLFVPSP